MSGKGKKRSEETKKKMSAAHKGRKKSDECRKRLSEAKKEYFKKNRAPNSKKIICLNDNKIFNSASDAGRFYNIPVTAPPRVCRKERAHYKGFVFEWFNSVPANMLPNPEAQQQAMQNVKG